RFASPLPRKQLCGAIRQAPTITPTKDPAVSQRSVLVRSTRPFTKPRLSLSSRLLTDTNMYDNLLRSSNMATASRNPLARYQSIGIILAGGGAKGAYQAGALKAINKFLRNNDALSK